MQDPINKLEIYIRRNVEAQEKRVGQSIDVFAFIQKVKTLAPDMKCPICGRKMFVDNKAPTKYKLHIEHLLPISKGGSNRVENLFPLCGDCNMSKGDKEIKDWYFGAKVATINNSYHGYEVTEQPPILVKKRNIEPGQYWSVPNRGEAPAIIYKRIEPVVIGKLRCNSITYFVIDGTVIYENKNYDEDYESEIIQKRYWPTTDTPTHQWVPFGELKPGDKFWGNWVSNTKYTKLKKHIFNWYNAKLHQLWQDDKVNFDDNTLVLVPVRK